MLMFEALRITDVRQAWAEYPSALLADAQEIQPPDSDLLEHSGLANLEELARAREEYARREYIRPLLADPGDSQLRLRFARSRIEAEDYNGGIAALTPLLGTEPQVRAEAPFLIGYAHAGLGDFQGALEFIEQAVASDPDNGIYARRLAILREAVESE